MKAINSERPKWKETLAKHAPLVLPSAHDALAARIIELAGFPAYQVGGFAMVGALNVTPDVDVEHFGEKRDMARHIIDESSLPVLIDGDNGFGDAKNITRTVREYEAMGASALFLEDQTSPKKCGHMAGKHVIPAEEMDGNIRAAVAARDSTDLSSWRAPTRFSHLESMKRSDEPSAIYKRALTAPASRVLAMRRSWSKWDLR